MRRFALGIGAFLIEYDTDFGCCYRKGWTVWWRGSTVAELMPLFPALVKGIRGIVSAERYWLNSHEEDK